MNIKKTKRIIIGFSLIISLLLTNTIVTHYEQSLSDFCASATNFIMTSHWHVRSFNGNGIPTSYYARQREVQVCPFYVVHYGLIYSQSLEVPEKYKYLLDNHTSLAVWNVQPPQKLITKKNFFHTANWIVDNIEYDNNGNAHLFYKWDSFYRAPTLNKPLSAPWYSGLTDAYALSLLCRAYVFTQDEKYKYAAYELYQSVFREIKDGGSVILLPDGNIWIEEYVIKNSDKQPMVLNGMIHATLGIIDFEKLFNIKDPKYPILLNTIKNYAENYDNGWWTQYDAVGNTANLKYHHVHVALMQTMYALTHDDFYLTLADKWEGYESISFFTRVFIKGTPTPNAYLVLCCLLAIASVICVPISILSLKLLFYVRKEK